MTKKPRPPPTPQVVHLVANDLIVGGKPEVAIELPTIPEVVHLVADDLIIAGPSFE